VEVPDDADPVPEVPAEHEEKEENPVAI